MHSPSGDAGIAMCCCSMDSGVHALLRVRDFVQLCGGKKKDSGCRIVIKMSQKLALEAHALPRPPLPPLATHLPH